MPGFDDSEQRRSSIALQDPSERPPPPHAAELTREESEWFRVTLESIGDGVIAADAEGRITFINRVGERLTGWSAAEAKGRPLADVFHIVNERTRQPVENPALRALLEGTVVGIANHTILIARDGSERLIDDSAAPIRNDAGAILGAVLVFRDVTAAKAADEARARLAAIVDSSDDAIVSKTLDGVIRSWNAGAQRIFGYTAAEAIGQPITLIIPPERFDEERGILSRLVRGERIDHFETVRVAKDGRLLDISLSVSPVRDSEGNIIGASKVARDITAQKQAAAALRLAEERGEFVRRASGVGFWYCDLPLDVFQWDELVKAHFHLPPDAKVTIETFFDRLHPDDRLRTRNAIERSIDERQPYDVEYRTVDPASGAEKWIRAIGRTYYAPDGAPVSFDGVTLDITQQKRLEQQLRRQTEQLIEADQKKDDFIALLAHELRNPLAPVRNGLQVMKLAPGDTHAVQEVRDMMDRQLTHMVRIIDDLLDVNRIGRNKMELRRTKVTLAEVVDTAVETASPSFAAAGVELQISLPSQPVLLDADLTRLAQVFSNLLSNSAKYTKRGGRAWLKAKREGREVVVSVMDTGIGIPAESLPFIFDMFSQVDRSIERQTGGLGIGLALVKGLTEMHGGRVSVESDGDNRGTTFTVRLPIVAESLAGVDAPSDESGKPAPARRRILVADDNRDSAESMAIMLQLLKNDVLTAHDGLDVLAKADVFRPDVVLMDVGMPKLNGLEATRKLRERPWASDVRIIAVTGWGQEGDRERTRAAGCDGHLVKPISLNDLQRLLEGA